MNFPSAVNFIRVSPALDPPIQTFPSLSVKMVCSEPGQPGTDPGTPQDLSRLPSMSNSSTAGGGTQHSAVGGVSIAKFSVLSRSRGRFNTQMWSFLSAKIPVTACMVQLMGNILGQPPSSLYRGAFCARTAGLILRATAQQRPNAKVNVLIQVFEMHIECSYLWRPADQLRGTVPWPLRQVQTSWNHAQEPKRRNRDFRCTRFRDDLRTSESEARYFWRLLF